MGEGTGLGMGLGRGDFRRPLDDFRVGSSRAAGPVPLTGGGTAGMRNSGLTLWHVSEILRDDLAPGPLNRERVLCFPLDDVDDTPLLIAVLGDISGGFSLDRHWSRMLRTSFKRSSSSGFGGSWKKVGIRR